MLRRGRGDRRSEGLTVGISDSWEGLPAGARVALEEQWAGLAARALACGSSVVNAAGVVVARGRNHAHDPAAGIHALERTRLAHAEFNALAGVDTDDAWNELTLFTTQHPCSMCAAAVAFTGVGRVVYVADDPSDESSPGVIAATRGGVTYQRLGSVEWAIIATIMFLYVGVEQNGETDGNVRAAASANPALGALVVAEVASGELGRAARAGIPLTEAFAHVWELIA
jgi:tRNA(Arg) A34 adenosine deaminase TadA